MCYLQERRAQTLVGQWTGISHDKPSSIKSQVKCISTAHGQALSLMELTQSNVRSMVQAQDWNGQLQFQLALVGILFYNYIV